MNRREAMQLMTSAAAAGVPVLALTGTDAPALAAGRADRSTWDDEYARFKAIDDEYDRRIIAEETASEAVVDECPRADRFFDIYGLSMGMTREHVARRVSYHVADREGYSGLIVYPPAAAAECERKVALMKEESERVADEFAAYQARHDEARKRHGVDGLRERVEEYRPLWFEARDRFMQVPAPDVQALMIKFEIAGTWVDDDYVMSSFADARRLLTATH
jgi:hypothetical protein